MSDRGPSDTLVANGFVRPTLSPERGCFLGAACATPNDVLENDFRTEADTVLSVASWALRVAEHVTWH